MEQKKRGRKRLGNRKRYHNVMLRFNDTEYEKLKIIAGSYDLYISERGTISPLLRRPVTDGADVINGKWKSPIIISIFVGNISQ